MLQGVHFRFQGLVRALAGLAPLLLLAACASTQSASTVDYAGLMSRAEAAVRAGEVEDALGAFGDAGRTDPTRKEPWLRTAQLQFERARYAHAIVAAEEVLQRDPDDLAADGILTVSGLRVAGGSLQRLQGRGALASDTARREAESLVQALRDTMGEQIFADQSQAAPPPRRRAAAPRRAPAARPAAAASGAADAPATSGPPSNPFERIGGN